MQEILNSRFTFVNNKVKSKKAQHDRKANNTNQPGNNNKDYTKRII